MMSKGENRNKIYKNRKPLNEQTNEWTNVLQFLSLRLVSSSTVDIQLDASSNGSKSTKLCYYRYMRWNAVFEAYDMPEAHI